MPAATPGGGTEAALRGLIRPNTKRGRPGSDASSEIDLQEIVERHGFVPEEPLHIVYAQAAEDQFDVFVFDELGDRFLSHRLGDFGDTANRREIDRIVDRLRTNCPSIFR